MSRTQNGHTNHEKGPTESATECLRGVGGPKCAGGTSAGPTVEPPRGSVIDLDSAVQVNLPRPMAPLEPSAFRTPDGRSGWVVQIPDSRPLATPAWAGGRLFLGGGYGSYSFYAIDALTGRCLWQTRTSDDGPTAAVVEQGLVAFNTESCSVIVVDAETGKLVWERWLGDPLMSHPAINSGRLYIAYPTGQRRPEGGAHGHPRPSTGHALLCAELATGRPIWEAPISSDVITAPVIEGGRVYITCFDGRSYCFHAADGCKVWEEDNRGTAAPLVVGDRAIVTERDDRSPGPAGQRAVWEKLRRRHSGSGLASPSGDLDLYYEKAAAYLSAKKGGGSPLEPGVSADLDKSVGFANAPAAAKLSAAAMHLGVGSVAGAWAYQGSRPAYRRGYVYNAQGRHVQCAEDGPERGRPAWEAEARGRQVAEDDQLFLPPAIAGARIYLCSVRGHVLSLDPETGDVDMLYDLGRPLCAQPCVAQGALYLADSTGQLIRLDTGRDDADGWYMWGGNARHNQAVL